MNKEIKLTAQTKSSATETWDNQEREKEKSEKTQGDIEDYLNIDLELYSKNQSYSKNLGRFIAEQDNL
jgi:hypothetical protein